MTSRDEQLTARECSFTCLFLFVFFFCSLLHTSSSFSFRESRFFFRRDHATRFSSFFRIAPSKRVALWISARLIKSEISKCSFKGVYAPAMPISCFSSSFSQVKRAAATIGRQTLRIIADEKIYERNLEYPRLFLLRSRDLDLLSQDSLTLRVSIRYGVSRLSSNSIRCDISDSICFCLLRSNIERSNVVIFHSKTKQQQMKRQKRQRRRRFYLFL